jgi:hypothetical protein
MNLRPGWPPSFVGRTETLVSDLETVIRRWCDDQDELHGTSGCPGGPHCIHAAVGAVRAVLAKARSMETGIDGPSIVGKAIADEYRATIARALGIETGDDHE